MAWTGLDPCHRRGSRVVGMDPSGTGCRCECRNNGRNVSRSDGRISPTLQGVASRCAPWRTFPHGCARGFLARPIIPSLSDMTRRHISRVPRCPGGCLARMMEFCIRVAWFMHALISWNVIPTFDSCGAHINAQWLNKAMALYRNRHPKVIGSKTWRYLHVPSSGNHRCGIDWIKVDPDRRKYRSGGSTVRGHRSARFSPPVG